MRNLKVLFHVGVSFAVATAFVFLLVSSSLGEDLVQSTRANQWKVYNINKDTGIWHVDKPVDLQGGGIEFPFNDVASGWFSIYLLNHLHIGDLTGKTITAVVDKANVPAGTVFWNRSAICANNVTYVRLIFSTNLFSGAWEPSDYWWSLNPVSWDLSTDGAFTLSVDMNPAKWLNINGQVGSTVAEQFAEALQNAWQVGLAFGSGCRYASGVAVDSTAASSGAVFQLKSYSVEP